MRKGREIKKIVFVTVTFVIAFPKMGAGGPLAVDEDEKKGLK